jgi:rhodanese-related sulfurtransferase
MTNDGKREPLRLSLEEAKELPDNEPVTVLDVVDPGSYEQTSDQIAGAVRIDPRDVTEEYGQLSQDRTVLSYCT